MKNLNISVNLKDNYTLGLLCSDRIVIFSFYDERVLDTVLRNYVTDYKVLSFVKFNKVSYEIINRILKSFLEG